MTKTLLYRVYENSDLDKVLELWNNLSGWGPFTKQDFLKRYVHTPYGKSLIIITTDDTEEILGQLIFIPSEIVVCGSKMKAYRVFAPVIHDQIRGIDIKNYKQDDHSS